MNLSGDRKRSGAGPAVLSRPRPGPLGPHIGAAVIIAGVGLSVLAVVLVGIVVARKVDGDSANFLVAGRRLGVPLVAASLMAAAVDANATVGNTDLTSTFGFWSGASLALGLAICLLLTGLFLARPMNRMGLFTLADFYRLRYGRGVEVASSVLMIFAFAILMAGNLVACGFLLETFLGLDYTIGVVVAVVLVLVYTIGGGMFSDAYTAAIQIAITLVATVAMLFWVGVTFGFSIPEGMGPFDFEQLTSTGRRRADQLGHAARARHRRHRRDRLHAADLRRQEPRGGAPVVLHRCGRHRR